MAGRVNCDACMEEAKLERYIFVASITMFSRACVCVEERVRNKT